MPKPARILNIYDKGSNYLILDNDDIRPLYHVHFNTRTLPHMTVSRASDPDTTIGSAIFFPNKKGGFFASASTIELTVNDHKYSFSKDGGIFSTNKRTLHTKAHGTLWWKGGYASSGFMKLIDGKGKIVADYLNQMYSGNRMGIIEIMNLIDVDDSLLDEIVVSGIAMLSEEKTSMTHVAASIASAGGMM